MQAAQALALLRGRRHAVAEDVADVAADVLRHRLVLTYDAIGDGVTADEVLGAVLERVGGARARDAGRRPRREPRGDRGAPLGARTAPRGSPCRPARRARARSPAGSSRRSTS